MENNNCEANAINKTHWNENATRNLITLYDANETQFKNPTIKNEIVWKNIANALKDIGFNCTHKQAEFKWKHLRKLYLKQIDNLGPKETGTSPSAKFQFFDQMDDIFRKKPNVIPFALAASSKGAQWTNTDVVTQSSSGKRKEHDSSDDEENSSEKSKRTSGKKKKIIDWLEEKEKKQEKARDERHKENISLQREAIDAYKEMMGKLIDKL